MFQMFKFPQLKSLSRSCLHMCHAHFPSLRFLYELFIFSVIVLLVATVPYIMLLVSCERTRIAQIIVCFKHMDTFLSEEKCDLSKAPTINLVFLTENSYAFESPKFY